MYQIVYRSLTYKYTAMTSAEVHSARRGPCTPGPVPPASCNQLGPEPGGPSPLVLCGYNSRSSNCLSTHCCRGRNSQHHPFYLYYCWNHYRLINCLADTICDVKIVFQHVFCKIRTNTDSIASIKNPQNAYSQITHYFQEETDFNEWRIHKIYL